MQVKINWRSTRYYTSTVTIPDDEYQEWVAENIPEDSWAHRLEPGWVKEFFEGADDWTHVIPGNRDLDFVHEDDETIDDISLA
jgi:hypothetical protein